MKLYNRILGVKLKKALTVAVFFMFRYTASSLEYMFLSAYKVNKMNYFAETKAETMSQSIKKFIKCGYEYCNFLLILECYPRVPLFSAPH